MDEKLSEMKSGLIAIRHCAEKQLRRYMVSFVFSHYVHQMHKGI